MKSRKQISSLNTKLLYAQECMKFETDFKYRAQLAMLIQRITRIKIVLKNWSDAQLN